MKLSLRRGVFSGFRERRRRHRCGGRGGGFVRTEKEENYLNFAAEKLLAENPRPVIPLTLRVLQPLFRAEIENRFVRETGRFFVNYFSPSFMYEHAGNTKALFIARTRRDVTNDKYLSEKRSRVGERGSACGNRTQS